MSYKISLYGKAMGGKTAMMEYFMKNNFHFQKYMWDYNYSFRKPDCINEIELKENHNNFLIEWTAGAIFYVNHVLTALLKDCKGILFMVPLKPFVYRDILEEWEIFFTFFKSYYKDMPIDQFPIVFCFNYADMIIHYKRELIGKSLSESDFQETTTDLMLPIKKKGEILEEPAPLFIQEEILDLNNKVNPWNHPWFITSSLYGYNLEKAFLTLVDTIIHKEKTGSLPYATKEIKTLPSWVEEYNNDKDVDQFMNDLLKEKEAYNNDKDDDEPLDSMTDLFS